MAFCVVLESGAVVEIDGNSAIIGRDPSCAIALPDDDRVETQHAMIKRVAGRWMVESQGEHLLRVGTSAPARVHWMQPGDTISLSNSGPQLIFNTATTDAAVMAQRDVTPIVNADSNSAHEPAAPAETPSLESPQKPYAAKPPLQSDPAPQTKRSNHPATWAIGGAVAVMLTACVTIGLLWSTGAFNHEKAPLETDPLSQDETKFAVGDSLKTDASEKNVTASTEEKPFDVNRALYSILLKTPEGQTFQLGTAFAVSPSTLLTTASVIEQMRELGSSQLMMKAFAYSPVTKQEYELDAAKTTLHPEFSKTKQNLLSAETKMNELEQQLQQASDEKMAESIIEKLTAQAEERYQLLEHRFYYDVGAIALSTKVDDFLNIKSDGVNPISGTKVQLAGIPVEQNQEMLDPNAPPAIIQSKGQVFAMNASPTDSNVKRLIIKCERDISGLSFPGSPVLNSSGEVLGIYARPTPPPFEPRPETSTVTTHDVTSGDRIKELGVSLD